MKHNVDITFHPSWYHKHTGVEFGEKFFFDSAYRVEADREMRRTLYEYFGNFGIGEKNPSPRPILFSDLLACGFLYSQLLGCEVVFKKDDAPNATHIGEYTGKSVMWWVQKNLAAFGVLISKGDDPLVQPRPTVIALWDNGTKAITDREDWIRAQCDSGKQVLVVDLPGVGAIEQAHVWGWSPYRAAYGTMYKMCCDLIYMDDSMAAMQTYHLLRTVDMLKDYWQIRDVSLHCDGQEGVYGILAGYLTDLHRDYGEKLLTSVERQILSQRPLCYDNTLSYLIPGMLKYFDYDELM